MNSIQIEYFLALAENLSFSETARQIHVSQPAISKQITALEREMGITLFERGYRNLKLTGSGRMVYEFFTRVAGEYEQMMGDIREDYERLNAVIRIGCIPHITIDSLPKAIKNFGEAFPQQSFHFEHAHFQTMRKMFDEGELDILIGMHKDVRQLPGTIWRTIAIATPYLVFSNDHPLAGRPDISVPDFAQEAFLSIDPTDSQVPSRLSHDLCQHYGFSPGHVQHYASHDSVMLAVESGLGVTVVHQSMVTDDFLQRFACLPTTYRERVVAAWKRNTQNSAVEVFIQELLRHVDHYSEEEE